MGSVSMGIPQEIILDLAHMLQSTIFVETGTYKGDTTRWAAKHFKTVHTIERATGLYNEFSPVLSALPQVTCHLGDSRDILPQIANQLNERSAVIWLDGHWSGGETAGSKDECPLLDELMCLSNRTNDIILIDDARLFLRAPPLPHQADQWPTIMEIANSLNQRREKPFVQIINDIIIAVPDNPNIRARMIEYARESSN